MRVRATQNGYHGLRRRKTGDVFVLMPRKKKDGTVVTPDQQFSENWMVKLDPEAKPKAKAKGKRESKKKDDPKKVVPKKVAEKPEEKVEEEPTEKAGAATGDQEII